MEREEFNKWLDTFCETIYGYDYFVDFNKVYKNVDNIKVQLNIMNSLIGSKNIEDEFEELAQKYPEILKCVPILIAVRRDEIKVFDDNEVLTFNFKNNNCTLEQYKKFMRETGLFDLLENHLIANLCDYVCGVETGLDSNARKNRGGDSMEDLVESYIKKAGFVYGEDYFKELNASDIMKKWDVDLSPILNDGESEKRFDFVIKKGDKIYGIETNFYSGSGSKLNETARSYKALSLESKNIENFDFVWVTDGPGWHTAKNNLFETAEVSTNLYNIIDLETGVFEKDL